MYKEFAGFSGFENAVIELLGPDALLGGEISIHQTAEMFWKAGRESMQKECVQALRDITFECAANDSYAEGRNAAVVVCLDKIKALPI